MKYAGIPYVDKSVSRIIFGMAMQPFLASGDGNACLTQCMRQALRHLIQPGIIRMRRNRSADGQKKEA